ncbi:MAG: DUF5696 domain-containing protein [Bacilli bacterium]
MKKQKITQENYYSAPFLKRSLYRMKMAITNWFHNFRLPLGKIIGLLIIVIMFLGLYFIVKANAIDIPVRPPYNHTEAEGFFSAISKYNTNSFSNKVYENELLIFTFDEQTTHFSVYNKDTKQTWYSHPFKINSEGDPVADLERDIVNVYYYHSLGAASSMGNYRYAVKEELINEINKGTDYWIRYNDEEKSVEVVYIISNKSLSTADFPTQISFDRFDEKIIEPLNEIGTEEALLAGEEIKMLYNPIPEIKAWKLKELGPVALQRIDTILKLAGYTDEDLAYDNADQGIQTEDSRASFEIGVKYTLTDSGLEAKIINESIVERANAPVIYIDFLPYFGSSTIEDSGYVVIPEGPGVLINHNSGKNYAAKRLYGPDAANTRETKSNDLLNISLPLYGVKQNDGGFVSIIKNGASMATLLAFNPTSSAPYNYAYYRFHYREGTGYDFVTWRTVQPVTIWTKNYSLEDYTIEYRFSDKEVIEYPDMANMYREYLLEHGLTAKDLSDDLILNLTMLGGYEYLSTTLGFPTTKVGSLTTFDQAKIILDELISDDVDDINIIFRGWMNGGIRHTSPKKIKNESIIGNRKQLIEFSNYLDEKGIGFYPEANIHTVYTDKNFSKKDDSVRTVFANVVESYRFNPATLRADRNTTPYYTLRSSSYEKLLDNMLKSYKKQKQDAISLLDLGNSLSGSYRNKDTLFRSDTETASVKLLERMNLENITKINLHNPSGYTLDYVTNAVDLTMFGPQSKQVDAAIPFYQLVVSGLFEYAGDSINLLDLYSYQTHVLKTIETGSNLHFTWSYEDTLDITKTEYNNYYSTYYKNWYEKAVDTYHEINDLGISGARLIDHKFINNNPKLVLVTYSNNISILINYTNNDILHIDELVPAMGYKVVS